VNEAKNYLLSNGGVYTPDDGDLAPMVCYISGTQLIFFEYPFVKPSEPLPELPTALLFGLGLLGIGGFVVIKRRTKAGTGK
jgi:LPXTG-motif cell wall-anchored protein